ncbi:hypothetical protein ACTQ5N_00295 [Atopobiaceae bacterium Sow4_H2]
MDHEKTFQIHLDPALIERFDDSLDRHEHISEQISFVEKAFEKKKYRGVPAWDCICTCVHRIRDGVAYLNKQELGRMECGSAFDFINFINNASVVLDCVQMLADILGVDLNEENSRSAVFNMVGSDGEGTDKKYYEFLRSLCAVHPAETDRHKRYQGADMVSCPYLIWTHTSPMPSAWGDCDIHAHAFANKANSWGEDVCIRIGQVFAYVEYRYGLLNKIESALERYQESQIQRFRSTQVLGMGESETEADFIDRLKGVELERFGSNNDFVYDFAKKVISFVPSNEANLAAASRYAEAWRFALSLQLNVLRDMSREGLEHAGIEGDETDWILFEHLLFSHSGALELRGFDYNLEKIHYLDGEHGPNDANWGRIKLREMDGVLGRRVAFDYETDSDEELYMLSRIALYEIALMNPCEINDAIPLDSKYRPSDAMARDGGRP